MNSSHRIAKGSFELAGLSTLRLSVLARAFISTRFGPSRVVCGPSGSAEQSQNTGNCDLVAHSFDGNGLDNRRALCFIIHIISGIIVIIGPQRFYRSPTRRPPVNAARKSRFPLNWLPDSRKFVTSHIRARSVSTKANNRSNR